MISRITPCLIACAIGLSSSTTTAQSDPFFATLDARQLAEAGENIAMPSRFEGLPIVEPHLSAHPVDNDIMLAAAMVVTDVNNPYQSCRLSSFHSDDGGRTWNETAHDAWGYDPWTAILADGQTAMSWLGTRGNFQHRFPVMFFSSADAGRNWSDSIQISPGAHDGTKIAARGDSFSFTTVRFRDDMGADVILFRRVGAGPFEEVAVIDGKGVRLNLCEPVVLADGTVGRIEVLETSGHRRLDEAAMAAAKQGRFRAAQRDGRPVTDTIEVPFEFRLSPR